MASDHEPVLASIHVLSNRITRAFESRLDGEHGLSVPEWRVLLSLSREPGLTATEIQGRWAMDKMAVSRAVRRLESAGNVRRKAHPSDGRSFVLELTAKGTRLFEKILPTADERYREILSGLSRGELGKLARILNKLIDRTDHL